MAFKYKLLGEASSLEVTINVTGEHERATGFGASNMCQGREAGVWLGVPIQAETMAIEPPRLSWISDKPSRVGEIDEAKALFAERRISVPKTFIPAKVREPRINAHTGPRSNQDGAR